jgi:hypothetical protein
MPAASARRLGARHDWSRLNPPRIDGHRFAVNTMRAHIDPRCRPAAAAYLPAPGMCHRKPGLRRCARALQGLVAAGLLGAAGVALAQGLPTLSPGLWEIWRSDSARTPARPPDLTICVDAAGVRDPALLMGEAPGDASCRLGAVRRSEAPGIDASLTCPGGLVFKASVRLASPTAFVTQLEPAPGGPRGASTRYIHAHQQGGCTR